MTRLKHLLVVCLIAVLPLPPVAAQPAKAAALPTSLGGSEAREFQTFMASLSKFGDDVEGASRTAKTQRNLAPLLQRASELKLAVSSAQRNLSTLINRLKDSGNWTPDFDRLVDERMKQQGVSPLIIAFYKNHGGARAVFSEGSRNLSQLTAEIDGNLKDLSAANTGAGADLLRVLIPTVYAIPHALKCGALFLATGVCIGFGLVPAAIGTGASAMVCALS